MTLLAQQWQDQVYYEVAGTLPGGPAQDPRLQSLLDAFRSQVPVLWEMAAIWAAKASGTGLYAQLRYLHTKRLAVKTLLGQQFPHVDAMLGRVLRLSYSQAFKQLKLLLDDVTKEIQETEKQLRAGRSPVSAAILQTAPVMTGVIVPVLVLPDSQPILVPNSFPDPNDPRWQGFPLEPLHPDPWR
jgi:hypothetical protein